MTEMLTVISERVDDIPLLLAQQERMGVPSLLDEHFSTHGHWQGLSLGWVATGWLTHILSEADHRLNHAQPWAEKRLETLGQCIGQVVRDLDFSDDRLETVLRALSDDSQWEVFEGALNQRLLRVYDLSPEAVRLDSTTASGYWAVTSGGLFQLGHSKDRRPDLPQVKVKLATLDPLGMPLVTAVVSGERADDPLYIPTISQVRESLRRRGLLYIGDCKMAALATRTFVQAGDDFYLCPLPQTQLPSEELEGHLAPVWEGKQALTDVYRQKEGGEKERIAEGFERLETLTAEVDGETITWTERRLVVRSLKQAQTAEEALRTRLAKAQTALTALNERGRGKKRFVDVEDLRQVAEAIVAKHRVQGLLRLGYQDIVQERPIRRYRDRSATVRVEREVRVTVDVDSAALEEAVRRLGWRVYATNAPDGRLTLMQAVLAYRSEYIIERGFGRLKGKPLSLTPMYLQRDDHATGLIRLLSIGLRVLTLVEFVVRRGLAAEGGRLAGLYAGNPKRATARPTTELLLKAFQEITLTIIQEAGQTRRHLTPLTVLQQRILELSDFPLTIYTRLWADSSKPP
ncbi:MAG: IS1634 family transposase [Chloroflexi bacterium]|nr:IS1634 family transposase [Chloroflexota bacterium]